MQHIIFALCQIRQIDICCCRSRQFFFRLFCRFTDTLHSRHIFSHIDLMFEFDITTEILCNAFIKIVAAQMIITACRQNFNHTITDFNDGNVESTAAQVIYHDLLLISMIQTISKGCTCRFVDDTQYIQTCNSTSVFCCLSLRVIEIRRYSDNCICDGFAQIVFCILTQFAQDHRTDFRRSIFCIVDIYIPVCTHGTLYRADGTLTVHNSLTLRSITHKAFTVFCKSHDRRCCALAQFIRDDHRSAAFDHGNAAIGCTEVDTDCFSHNKMCPF